MALAGAGPRFLAVEFRDYFLSEYPATATRRNSDTHRGHQSVNMGPEFCYEMAHQQRIIFKRQHCRRYHSINCTARPRSFR